MRVAYEDLDELQLGGPGEVTADAGLVGFGFGAKGAAKGILAASVINALTRETRINTLINLNTGRLIIYLHSSDIDPRELEPLIAEAKLAMSQPSSLKASSEARASSGVVAELRELAALKDEGVLTEAEFKAAKRKLLQK